jgi:hypothetical protein
VSVARFKVLGRLEMASRPTAGTVIIDRGAGLFSVRPLRRRRLYTLPLGDVASWVVRSIISADVREKRAAKAARRRRS